MKSKFFTGTKEETKEEVVEVTAEDTPKEEVKPIEIEVKTKVEETTLDNVAFSMCRNPVDNLFYVVKITFDISTGEVGKMEFIDGGVPERYVAIENFKINVARNGLVS